MPDNRKYIMALDQGTTSSRTIIFDDQGGIVAVAQKEFSQIFPQPGWVEHDPFEILTSQLSSAVEALGKLQLRPRDVAGVGITNQRETTIVWDRETGKPVYTAMPATGERWRGGNGPGEDGVADRSVFFGDEDCVDSRQRCRGAGAG